MLGLMLDESTDQSGKKVLLLYLRFCQAGRFVTKFWAALEVVDASAEGLFHLITKHFDAMEVPFSKLFTYASDGASVVASKLGGLAGLLTQRIKRLHIGHA